MKTARRFPAALLAAVLALLLSACYEKAGVSAGGEGAGFRQVDESLFQKHLRQSGSADIDDICETDAGFYFISDLGPGLKFRLYYMDRASKRVTVLCAKPDCDHTDGTCNAMIDGFCLWTDGEKLYFARSEHAGEGSEWRDLGKRVYSEELDGTGRREVMSLELAPVNGRALSSFDRPAYHKGTLYFVYNGAVYAVPLDGDIEDARRIWGEDYSDGASSGGYSAVDPEEPHYELWADGDFIYFMVNVTQPDGTQKDTLFAYNTADKRAYQVWQTPDAEEVGTWETTGVSVSRWYVLDGTIYFYLSGGDFWRSDLETGETVRLADTHEKTLYGTAVFSDDYMCLLNDHPIINLATGEYWLGVGLHEGGDTVFVYTLDGELTGELPLDSLSARLGKINGYSLLFCDGENVYFNADAGYMSEPVNGASHKLQNNLLCCVNIKSGEITEIYNWQ